MNKKVVPFFLLFSLLFSFNLFSRTIEDESTNDKMNLEFFFEYGIEFKIDNALNVFLSENNYRPISYLQNSPTYIAYGFTLRNRDNPLITQFFFNENNDNRNNSGNNSSIISYGINMNALYDLSRNQEWVFAPLLGVCMNNYYLIATSNNLTSSLSGNMLDESFQMNNVFGLKFGVGIERQIKISSYNLSLGLNSYYRLDVGNKLWKNTSNIVLENIPSMGRSGFGVLFKMGVVIL